MSNSPGPDRNRVDPLAFVLLFAACLLAPVGKALSQEALSSASEAAGLGWLPAVPVQITAGVDMGYDDNVTLSSAGQGSVFARENVVLTYARPSERTQVSLIGVGNFTQNFDVTGLNEKSGNVTMALTHNFSTRLSFYASVYGTYQKQPNFQSNVGPENVVSPFFDTVDIFALTYHWSSRFSLVTATRSSAFSIFPRRTEILRTVFRTRLLRTVFRTRLARHFNLASPVARFLWANIVLKR